MKEIWKDIPSLNGYQASNLGNIRSLNYHKTGKIKELSKYSTNFGYLAVKITQNGIGRRYLVHRLVLITFKGEKENKEINHIDGNKHNNCVNNLEWCTRRENILHAYKNKLKVARSGSNHPKAKKVLQIKNGEVIREYSYLSEVDKYGFNHSKVTLCCQGKRKRHKGYEWRYKESEVV